MPASQRLHAAFAMAALGRVEGDFLVESIASAWPDELRNLIAACVGSRKRPCRACVDRRKRRKRAETGRKRLGSPSSLCTWVSRPSPTTCCKSNNGPTRFKPTTFIKTFPIWHGDLADLLPVLDAADSSFRSGVCCAIAVVPPDTVGPE